MLRFSSSSAKRVGVQVPVCFLRPPLPTKHGPLSDRMVAGTPNLPTACRSTTTAFFEVASLNNAAPVTRLEASSRNVIKLSPLKRGSFIMRQSVCHMELECLLSWRTRFLFLDFAADGVTSPFPFIIPVIPDVPVRGQVATI